MIWTQQEIRFFKKCWNTGAVCFPLSFFPHFKAKTTLLTINTLFRGLFSFLLKLIFSFIFHLSATYNHNYMSLDHLNIPNKALDYVYYEIFRSQEKTIPCNSWSSNHLTSCLVKQLLLIHPKISYLTSNLLKWIYCRTAIRKRANI